MNTFLQVMQPKIKGVLTGLDRIRFRGTIRWLSSLDGMATFLHGMRILLKDFTPWAKGLTKQIDEAAERLAREIGQEKVIFLQSSNTSKEETALRIAAERNITEGLICVLKCVEPCHTFKVGPNRELKKLELRSVPGKCSHYYFYSQHPELGLIHFRLQSWLPFTIHVCMNGREWLGRQLRRAGIGFEQRDNCFVHLEDIPAAQSLFDQQLRTDWAGLLNGLRRLYHPAHETLFRREPLDIYWSADETEWATDVMFRSPKDLNEIYPGLVRHAISAFDCQNVLRFLGRPAHVQRYRASEVMTTFKKLPEGICVKHRLNRNSIKMYNKQEMVLRVETTINDAHDMKVYRSKETEPDGPKTWQRLRKGVADLHRRADVSQQSNERYLEALATANHARPLQETIQDVCQPTEWQGRRVRALQPFSPDDSQLLAAVNRGEFSINGFRNRDLRAILHPTAAMSPADEKRQAARITRQIRMLRGHGLIRKVPTTHRYVLTNTGREKINAILMAQQASCQKLTQLAV